MKKPENDYFTKKIFDLKSCSAFLIPFCISLFSSGTSAAQAPSNLLIGRQNNLTLESSLQQFSYNDHSAIKPYMVSSEIKAIQDSLYLSRQDDSAFFRPSKEHSLSLRLLSNSEAGFESKPKSGSYFDANIGGDLSYQLKNKLALYGAVVAGASTMPSYYDSLISNFGVIPGIGRAFGTTNGYSWQYYSGYLSYSPGNVFNFQIGRDKHFWGDGYRSLFLSDISSPYPFLKISAKAWKIKYTSLFANMQHVGGTFENWKTWNKYGSFHYLSWNVSRRVNLSLFESIIWMGSDSNRIRYFDINYLNPVIFFRPVEYSLGSSDNAFVGGAFKIKVGKRFRQQFYGQLILDEFLLKEVMAIFKKLTHPFDSTVKYGWWANKQGVQLGFKSFDLFTLKNLVFQTEINAVRPYTYAHGNVQQNYAHLNQPLAHPLGANFGESVNILNYSYRRWQSEMKFNYSIYGKNENGLNWGHNIFETYLTHPIEYGNKFFQGLKTTRTQMGFKVGFMIIPTMQLKAEAGWVYRIEKNSLETTQQSWILIGLNTPLFDRYDDL